MVISFGALPLAGEKPVAHRPECTTSKSAAIGANGFMKTQWIKHTGNSCPVDVDVMVDVKLASGGEFTELAGYFGWTVIDDCDSPITHYRLTSVEQKPADVGNHYRYEYKGVKLDPYRVCKVYGLDGGPREHIVKKGLRGVSKGHTELELIAELRACLDRWEEMVVEDSE